MKKIIFALPVVVLLAAGCNSSQHAANQTTVQTPVAQNTTTSPTPAPIPTSSPVSGAVMTPMPKPLPLPQGASLSSDITIVSPKDGAEVFQNSIVTVTVKMSPNSAYNQDVSLTMGTNPYMYIKSKSNSGSTYTFNVETANALGYQTLTVVAGTSLKNYIVKPLTIDIENSSKITSLTAQAINLNSPGDDFPVGPSATFADGYSGVMNTSALMSYQIQDPSIAEIVFEDIPAVKALKVGTTNLIINYNHGEKTITVPITVGQ